MLGLGDVTLDSVLAASGATPNAALTSAQINAGCTFLASLPASSISGQYGQFNITNCGSPNGITPGSSYAPGTAPTTTAPLTTQPISCDFGMVPTLFGGCVSTANMTLGIPNNYLYIGGAALLLFLVMKK